MKRKLLSLFMAAVTACYALPIYTYAVNDYEPSEITKESQKVVSEPSDMHNYKITPDGKEVYQTQIISQDGSVLPEEADTQADGINTDFPDDMEKPEVIHIDEKIDVDFEIKPSEISLFSMEKDLFDCGTDYAYQDFAKRSNPEGRQAFYNKLLEVNRAFASDTQDVPETTNRYIISEIDISGYNLTENETVEVYFMFRQDHPEYYWLSNSITYSGNSIFYVPVYSDYAQGSVRSELKTTMMASIEKYAALVEGLTSNYEIALTLHDAIIDDVEYGYDADGNALATPYAHSIVGALDGDAETDVVCEAYAKTYQLLLNYCGVNNVLIAGDAGEKHMWNAVKMDDGNYYLVDLTWDDQPKYPKGCAYEYFATDSSKWTNRTPHSSSGAGVLFQYDLPEIPNAEYVPEGLEGAKVGTEFIKVPGEHQGVGSYNFTVTANNSKRKEVFVSTITRLSYLKAPYEIPEKVTYQDIEYTVVGIDVPPIEQDGSSPNELYFPDSVEYIGRMVSDKLKKFNISRNVRHFESGEFQSLNSIEFDNENPNFIMEDDALYSSDKSKLYIRVRGAQTQSFTVPDSVKEISDYALAFNKYLTDVTLSENLTSIPYRLFYNCENLNGTLIIPDNVSDINSEIISGTSITSVKLPLKLNTFIYDSLTCDSLEEVSISSENTNGYSCSDGVLYYNHWYYGKMIKCYPNNKKDETYHIQDGTCMSTAFLFQNSKNLKTVYVPDTYNEPEQIKNMVDNSSVSNIVIDADNPVMTSEDGIVYSKDMKTILRVPPCKDISVYTIPENIECISRYSFENVKLLNELTFSSSVKEVSFGGFYGCENLKKVTFNEGLQSIESGAFMYTALENVALPDTVTSIGTALTGAFQDCKNLKEIKLSENLSEIPRQAFSGCSSLNKITIPKNVKRIGYHCFPSPLTIIFCGDCPELDGNVYTNHFVYYYEGNSGFENNSDLSGVSVCKIKQGDTYETTINSYADALEYLKYETKSDGTIEITGCDKNIYGILRIPDEIDGVKVTSIGDHALSECRTLNKVEIPSGIIEIKKYAFNNCVNITDVKIENGLEIINEDIFWGCKRLTDITIPESVTYIDSNAFGASHIRSITVDENNSMYSSSDGVLFDKNKTTLLKYPNFNVNTKYVIPDGVTNIGEEAFKLCYYLTEVTIPDSITDIGDYAFSFCSALRKITVPKRVAHIGSGAFSGCDLLTEATLLCTITKIDYGVFRFCSDDLVIKGYTDSVVETYASENDIAFESLGIKPDEIIASGKYSDTLSWTLSSYGALKINGTGETTPNLPQWWDYSYRLHIKTAEISGGVTNIGRRTLSNCDSLTDITIHDGVTNIDSYAFYDCDNLTSVTIPYTVTNISYNAIYNYSADLVIKGYTGSAAETYANENNITFESIGTMPTASPSLTPTASATPTPTATPTASPTPTASATPTASPSPTPTVTDEPIKEVAPIGKYADKVEITKELECEKAVFTITPTDNTEIPSVTLYIAKYADDGTLTGLKLGDCVKTGNTVTITADLPKTDNYKFMLWDGEQCPLIKAITDIYN